MVIHVYRAREIAANIGKIHTNGRPSALAQGANAGTDVFLLI